MATSDTILRDVTVGVDAFEREVESALKLAQNPRLLGERSPLASPYFLGQALSKSERDTPQERGRALIAALQSAAEQLPSLAQSVLRHIYFERVGGFTLADIAQEVALSERQLYRERASAVRQLADVFNHTVVPPLRPEAPTARAIVGREAILAASLAALNAGGSVALSGAAGVGKSTLGAIISASVPNGFYWHTIRRGLNDHLDGLVFGLAFFLRSRGAGHTWRQLVADGGTLHPERILPLLRYDLSDLRDAGKTPLVIVDEVDLIQPDTEAHAQILHALEDLRGFIPLLLIGQRVVIEADKVFTLVGLTVDEFDALLRRNGLDFLPPAPRKRLLAQTQGNPALLTLFVALHQSGADAEQEINALPSAPTLEAMFNRVWQHLGHAERSLLFALSVFRGSTSPDAFPDVRPTLDELAVRNLVLLDSMGGVAMSPYFRQYALQRVPGEQQNALHRAAAQVRAERGEIIEAMYHFIEGRHQASALWLWDRHRGPLIEQGGARAAYELLQRIAIDDLEREEDKPLLRLHRGRLAVQLGLFERAEDDLDAIQDRQHADMFSAARSYQGTALEERDQLDEALDQYRQGISSAQMGLEHRWVDLHIRASHLLAMRAQDVAAARDDALHAWLYAQSYLALAESRAGALKRARQLCETALELVDQQAGYLFEKSRLLGTLGVIDWKQGRYDDALRRLRAAIVIHQQRGDILAEAIEHINVVGALILDGRNEDAIEDAVAGLAIAERIHHTHAIAYLSNNAAEAACNLGRLEDAERYALQAVAQEELGAQPYVLTVLGTVRRKQGRIDDAVTLLRDAIDAADKIQNAYAEAAAWRALGDAYRDLPSPADARDAYAASLRLYRRLELEKESAELTAAMGAL